MNVETNFEKPTFHPGSVNKQDGWRSAAPGEVSAAFCTATYPTLKGQYDQEVKENGGGIPAFGAQSLRMSNACGTGDFTEQTYSKPNKEPAGESESNNVFITQFSFVTTTPNEQPGLNLNVSPTDSGGARLSWVGLIETEKGTQVAISECCDVVPIGEPLKRGVPHTIKLWMKLSPGPDNDFVRLSIDGKDVGQCFGSWENYYRSLPEEAKPVDQLIFRSALTVPSVLGQGYLFDNVSSTTGNRPDPPSCEMPIEKQADKRTVRRGGTVELPDHRPQPWQSHRPRLPRLRSHPAGDDVRERRPQAGSQRRPALPRDHEPRARPALHLPCRAPRRCERRAGQHGQHR